MNVTVFGASGFVGINVVKKLVRDGFNVTASDLKPMPVCHTIPFVKADLTKRDQVERAMTQADIVVHLAASPLGYSIKNPVHNARVNIIGSLNILDTARSFPVVKTIFSSASSIIGDVMFSPVAEGHVCKPKTPYAVAKQTVEQYLRVYHELYDLNYLVFRFFNVYGPWQYPSSGALIPSVWSKLMSGTPVQVTGNGSQVRDFIYVKDIAAIISQACKVEVRNTTINMGTGVGTTIKEIVDLSAEILGVEPNIEYLPQRPGEITDFVANASRLKRWFKDPPITEVRTGLEQTFDWLSSAVKEVS